MRVSCDSEEELLAQLLAEHWVKIVIGQCAGCKRHVGSFWELLEIPTGLGLSIAFRLPQLFLSEDGLEPGSGQ